MTTQSTAVSAVILAAGEGTRMRSALPKPLHRVCGRSMLLHVIHALADVHPGETMVVVGHGSTEVRAQVSEQAPDWAHVRFAEQATRRGTGDATRIALDALSPAAGAGEVVLVLPGDTPLLSAPSLAELLTTHLGNDNAATMLTSVVDDPTGYGRVISGPDGTVRRIVEQNDASPEELDVDVINAGIYAFRRDLLGPALAALNTDNVSGEYYLPDVIGAFVAAGHRVGCIRTDHTETRGVNDRWQLALAERQMRARINRHWMMQGVTMTDPRQTFIDVTVHLEPDVILAPGTIVEGTTRIGTGSRIGPDTHLVDCEIGPNCVIETTHGTQAHVEAEAEVGPFAHLPPGSRVISRTRTGAFYTAQRT